MTDEEAIRELIATWHRATAAGDHDRILGLMADDVVFLASGRPPIRGKVEFDALQRAAAGKFRIQSTWNVLELVVHGGWSHCWTQLEVTMFPVQGGETVSRAGHTLSLFRKEPDGRWVLARDANLLAPVVVQASPKSA